MPLYHQSFFVSLTKRRNSTRPLLVRPVSFFCQLQNHSHQIMASSRPDFGRRLLLNVIDQVATAQLSKVFVLLPRNRSPRDGLVEITFSAFGRAIDRCAWWLEEQCGRSDDWRTFNFMSHARGFRYPIMLFAALKTGHKVCECVDLTGCPD